MRIEDIAKKVNLSNSTVSRVLNNSKSVKPETRRIVLEALEETGYVPNLIARSLRTSSQTIAVVTQDILNPYYIEALYAIEKICRENGFAMMSLNSDNSKEIEKQNLIQLLSMRVGGVIFLANMLTEHNAVMRRCRESDVAIVTMEGFLDGVDSVISDCKPGVRQGIEYLLRMGHRQIGICHGSMRSMPATARIDEMKRVLAENGVPFDEHYQFFGDDYLEQLERARTEKRLPTALFTINDNCAISIYRWCRDVGLRIPEDLSVLGFDDISLADLLSPPLTTIAQPIGYLTKLAMKQLIARMRSNEDHDHVCQISVPTELVVRQSVARLEREALATIS